MKNFRFLLVLLMIFVVLVVLLVVQNKQQDAAVLSTPTPGGFSSPIFADVTLNTIAAIRLRSPETGKTFLLSRATDGSWTAPLNPGKLDPNGANNIAKTMVLLPYNQTLTLPAKADKTVYGFTPSGVLSIEVILTNGVSHAVEIGYRTPTSEFYYALVDDRPDLYLVERAPIDYLIFCIKSPPVS